MEKYQKLLRLSAIGLWIYAAAMLVRKILRLTNNWWTIVDLKGHEIFMYSFTTLAIVSMVVAFFTIYRMRDLMPKIDTTTRIFLHLIGWTAVICTCDILIDTFLSYSRWFIYIDLWIPICFSFVSGIILWRIGSQTGEGSLPKGLPGVLKVAGTANCVVILLIVVAALHVAFTGHVFGFRTCNWITLVSFLTASVVLPWLAIGCTIKSKHMNKLLSRFTKAQGQSYDIALEDIKAGQKRSHWIWYIFPQMKGLGLSEKSQYYGIQSKEEAEAYLADPILGARLREITAALLMHAGNKTAWEILGGIDAIKVRSCMTLFDTISPNDIFAEVLQKFYDGVRCEKTVGMLNK